METTKIEQFVLETCQKQQWELDPNKDFRGMAEELGELGREIRRIEDGRERPDEKEPNKERIIEMIKEEAGDFLFPFVKVLHYYGITLEEAFEKHKEKLEKRYSQVNQVNKGDYEKHLQALLNTAIEIATIGHEGQMDKGGNPYIEHPRNVAARMETLEEKIAAWLHDVPEDTAYTLDYLRDIFPSFIVDAVDALTKRDNETKAAYYYRLSQNKIGKRVKLFGDHMENMNISRIPHPTENDRQRVEQYKKWHEILSKAGLEYFYGPNQQGDLVWNKMKI